MAKQVRRVRQLVRSAPPARVAEFHYGQEPKKCYIIDYVYDIYQEYKKENGA